MTPDERTFEHGTCAACGEPAVRATSGWWAHRDTKPCDWRVAGFERARFVATDSPVPAGLGEEPAGTGVR
jgi:hypothetical protein